jgi:hypothetical protein
LSCRRGKEPGTWKSDETDPDETEPDDDEGLGRPNKKDAIESSGDESLSRPDDQPVRRSKIKEELPTAGQIDGRSTSMTEERKEGREFGDQMNGPNDMVGNPGDHQLIAAPNLHLMGQPIQERCVPHHHSLGLRCVFRINVPFLFLKKIRFIL